MTETEIIEDVLTTHWRKPGWAARGHLSPGEWQCGCGRKGPVEFMSGHNVASLHRRHQAEEVALALETERRTERALHMGETSGYLQREFG